MQKQLSDKVKETGNRGYHLMMGAASKVMPWPRPEVVVGAGSAMELPEIIEKCGIHKVMVVTDPGVEPIVKEKILPCLDQYGSKYQLFAQVGANPTDKIVEDIFRAFRNAGCDGMIAVGGGSPIDAAKGALARLARPHTDLCKMAGMFRVLKRTLPLIAVPTTSGSGSEASVVAVIVEDATRHKVCITDPVLMPKYAVLDPQLMVSMPQNITATTGMDALTHAIESYVAFAYGTTETGRNAEAAAVKVFRYLERAYTNGEDLEAREQMAMAACMAGSAFTRTGLGHVHAISHAISGVYNTPHGLANAVLLPIVLEDYGEAVHPQLAHLAEITGVRTSGSDADKARALIAAIREMNRKMGIPTGFDFIRQRDIPKIVKWATYDGNISFPSPVVYTPQRCRHILNRLIGEA